MSTPHNLQLAREMFEHVVQQSCPCAENADIWTLIDSGDEYTVDCLPGDSIEAIGGSLRRALHLTNEPALIPATGRDRKSRQHRANLERERLALFLRIALALIEGEGRATERADTNAETVLRCVRDMADTYLRGGRP